MTPKLLVLWDIDHTLITMGGLGRELSAQAFRQATGEPMLQQAAVSGMTEPVIFRETAKLHNLATDRSDFEKFAKALAEAHEAAAAAGMLRNRGHGLSGAANALDALAGCDGVVQTVVTGNVRPVAEIKLRVFGLDRHIVWEAGAYGEDADEREELVLLALQRAAAHTGLPGSLAPENAVLIGDTPADVRAGLAAEVRVVAVASGRSSEEELREAGASTVVRDLTNTKHLLELATLCVADGT